LSFRGPALELREVLREILDHLAPDKDVMQGAGFQIEKGRSGPTMKQKVRYILKKRGDGKTKASSPEDSVSTVDVMIGELTRSVYDLGSLATHVSSERRQVVQVKRYIEAVLHDILQIS
jgi:Predicted pPIWI-associating nuclease